MSGGAEAAVVDRAFIRVGGADAATYLQGQLSQDLGIGAGLSFLLDPGGKVVALVRFGSIEGGILLDTDPEAGEAVVARLRRFLLRTEAEVADVEVAPVLRVFGAPRLPEAHGAAAWPLLEDRPQDVMTTGAAEARRLLEALGATPIGDDEHERRRILAVVPRSGVDIGPDTIPAEAGRWTIEQAVSFTKGCYTGQELVARIDSRGGNVPRPLRLLRFDAPVAVGDRLLDADGGEVGHVTSAAGEVALAPVARRVEVGGTVRTDGVAGAVEQ
jgi:folate-binding protein YgfZ